MSEFPDQEIQVGDVVNISGTRITDSIIRFEITNIDINHDSITIDLINIDPIDPDNPWYITRRELRLEISPDGNKFLDANIADDSIVEFLGPVKLDIDLLEGLQCDSPHNLRSVIKIFEDFWYNRRTDLVIQYLGCTELPPKYFSHQRIIDKTKELNLIGNKLTSLPSEIGDLVNLEDLILSDNELEFVPYEIANLVDLHTLDLQHNKLESLPLEIGSLPNLVQLRLWDNPLHPGEGEEETPMTIEQFREEWRRHIESGPSVKSARKH